jgi:hypothetical protein
MRKKQYDCFVSYTFQTEGGAIGFGNTHQFWTNRKKVSPKEIREMESIIAKEKKYKNVVIMNYILS